MAIVKESGPLAKVIFLPETEVNFPKAKTDAMTLELKGFLAGVPIVMPGIWLAGLFVRPRPMNIPMIKITTATTIIRTVFADFSIVFSPTDSPDSKLRKSEII